MLRPVNRYTGATASAIRSMGARSCVRRFGFRMASAASKGNIFTRGKKTMSKWLCMVMFFVPFALFIAFTIGYSVYCLCWAIYDNGYRKGYKMGAMDMMLEKGNDDDA